MKRNVSDKLKKQIAGKQGFKCANYPNAFLDWKNLPVHCG